MWKIKLINVLAIMAVVATLFVGACAIKTVNPDGSVVISEPDYTAIQLMSTASVGAWAAAQKDGISANDAKALLTILAAIEDHRADGSPIIASEWTAPITQQVPKRYQGLAMVVVALVAMEMDKYQVSSMVPVPGSVPDKIMKAIVEGAKAGLAPYLTSYQRHELLENMPVSYSKA